ncbi:MAG: response regulator [Xenococcaceae cyanobacterium MO_167.B52]|nr:response regulator [Xenococcaceae cyanobacterium MO_167.B52]
MTAKSNSEVILIKDFSASAQISLFQKLKEKHFSGQLHIQEVNQEQKWVFFLYVGRIIHAIGGIHNVRRWRRNLVSYLPQIASQLQQELESIKPEIFETINISWDYELLNFWVAQQKVHREQANQVIRGNITEILFDISQAGQANYYLKPQAELGSQQLVLIDSEQQIIKAWKLWQTWKEANLAVTSPNLAPAIVRLEELQQHASEKTYTKLIRLLTGKHSLRDLAIQRKTNPLTIARLIMPHIKLKFLEFTEIPDIPLPLAVPNHNSIVQDLSSLSSSPPEKLNPSPTQSESTTSPEKLVAYVNRNPLMSKIMAQIIKGSGYKLISDTDPLNAIAVLLDRKPDIIFIDIELSGINGYELCSQLKQIDCFKETPIILFGKNINPLDRVKAKMSGCSELFSKSAETKSILDILNQYLPASL